MKTILTLFIVLFSSTQLAAWDWWWNKKQSLNDKQLVWQRKQINDPTNPYINFNAGVAAYKKQQFDAAAGSFDRAIQYAPEKKIKFKKQAHFNSGRTEYRRALGVVGPSWENEKLSDEVFDKAIGLTDLSIKQFEAVLVLDAAHQPATKAKEEVETFKNKLLVKKYGPQKQKKPQQPGDKNQQQQGDGSDQQQSGGQGDQAQQQGGSKGKGGGQQGKDKRDTDNQKDDTNKGDDAKDDQKDQGRDGDQKSEKDDDQGKQKSDKIGDQKNDEKGGEQGNRKPGSDGQGDEKGKQKSGEKSDDKNEQESSASSQGGASGEEWSADEAMERALDAHSQALLDRAEQAAGNAQKRVMAHELLKMNRGGAGGNQKSW